MVENYTTPESQKNREINPKNYSFDQMLAASQVNASKRPNRFFAKRLAEKGLV